MKSRRYNIVIQAEFDEEQDADSVADCIMKALQHPSVPTGRALVASSVRLPNDPTIELAESVKVDKPTLLN